MTRFSLTAGETASLPRTPVIVRASGVSQADAVRIQATTVRGDPFDLRRANGLAIVPTLNQSIILSVTREDGSPFPHGSVIELSVGAEHDADADHVQTRVDPAGLPQLDVLRLEPLAQRLIVTALGRVADPHLPPMAEAARGYAREQLGVVALPTARGRDLRVALDASPSMRGYLESGAVTGLLEILVGMASVVDPDRQLDGLVCSRDEQEMIVQPLQTFAADLAELARRTPLRTGCRPPALAGGRTTTYFLSDALPRGPWLETAGHCVVVLTPKGEGGVISRTKNPRGPANVVTVSNPPPDSVRSPTEARTIVAELLAALPTEEEVHSA